MTPIRPDLAAVQPFYYPLVEHAKFGSVRAMCKRLKVSEAEIQRFVDLAAINQSDMVVCDQLVLGDPEHKCCAVLLLQPGGAVTLCVGMFGDASQDRAQVEAFVAELMAHPEFKGRHVAIGEFRPTPAGAAS